MNNLRERVVFVGCISLPHNSSSFICFIHFHGSSSEVVLQFIQTLPCTAKTDKLHSFTHSHREVLIVEVNGFGTVSYASFLFITTPVVTVQ